MGPAKLSETLHISMDEAKKLINGYYMAFPGIKEFLYQLTKQVERNKRAISTLDGRIRDLSSLDWDSRKHVGHACNIAKNMPFQGGNASMIKRAMVNLYRKIEETGRHDLKLVGCVHDEFIVEGDKDKLEEGKKLVVDAMVEAGEYYVKSVPMVVDVDVGDHWIKG